MSAEPVNPVPVEGEDDHHGALSRLRNYFLTGLILVGPIYITVSLTWWFINWVDDAMRPFIPVGLQAETYLPFKVPGYGLVIALLGLTLLGFLTANLVGRSLVEFGEKLLNRMPIVRPVYKTMKQVFEMLFSKSGSGFRKVALAPFPPGMWSVVFLAPAPAGDIAAKLPQGDDYISCFLPCAPNPTTGFFFYVRRDQLIELDVGVEQAMTLIMSAGMVQPGSETGKGEAPRRLAAALAEQAAARREASPPTAPSSGP